MDHGAADSTWKCEWTNFQNQFCLQIIMKWKMKSIVQTWASLKSDGDGNNKDCEGSLEAE